MFFDESIRLDVKACIVAYANDTGFPVTNVSTGWWLTVIFEQVKVNELQKSIRDAAKPE